MQYPALAQYLGLPASLTSLLETPVCCDLLSSLLGRPRPANPALPTYPMGYRVAGQLPGPGPTPRPGLVQLPHNYTDLMNLAATFSCSRSFNGESKVGDGSRWLSYDLRWLQNPALCLLCGAVVCAKSHCCQDTLDGLSCGGCTVHARHCAADTGIFLLVRESVVVLHSRYTQHFSSHCTLHV